MSRASQPFSPGYVALAAELNTLYPDDHCVVDGQESETVQVPPHTTVASCCLIENSCAHRNHIVDMSLIGFSDRFGLSLA
jgi:hypothetical protein